MASPMEAFNASRTSFPSAIHATISSSQTGIMSQLLENMTIFRLFLTLFGIAVAYDQSMLTKSRVRDGMLTERLQYHTGHRKAISRVNRSRYRSSDHFSRASTPNSTSTTRSGYPAISPASAFSTSSSSLRAQEIWRERC